MVARMTRSSRRFILGSIRLQPCEVRGTGGGRCGTDDVYAVFWLEGGPGGAATQAVGPVSQG
jgi:hypothetical protein